MTFIKISEQKVLFGFFFLLQKRDILTRNKQVRDAMRIENVKLRQKCGLLGNEPLLRDYEQRKEQVLLQIPKLFCPMACIIRERSGYDSSLFCHAMLSLRKHCVTEQNDCERDYRHPCNVNSPDLLAYIHICLLET